MNRENGKKAAHLICFAVISIAVTGYFVGLQAPMNPAARWQQGDDDVFFSDAANGKSESVADSHSAADSGSSIDDNTVLATHYSEMHRITARHRMTARTSLLDLKSTVDPMKEIIITPQQKTFALALREKNRAFNGAPPTIPHPIDQMAAESCMACHGTGFRTTTLRISKMSHQFLTNCTQCHVESSAGHMPVSVFRENTFVGLPAPTGGPTAYAGAPPMIPHSTWMRVDCISCHGVAGQQGIRTTHPWRTNCQQCHAPSSSLEQSQLNTHPQFLPPPTIENK